MEVEMSRLLISLGGGVLSLSVFFSHAWNRPLALTSEERSAWELVRSYIRGSSRVLADPPVVSLLIEQNVPLVDSGQSEFFLTGGQPPEIISWAVPNYSDKAVSRLGALATRVSRDARGEKRALIMTLGYP